MPVLLGKRMNRITRALTAALLIQASSAHAAFFTSDAAFLGANPDLTTLDFEGIAASGSFAAYTPAGFSSPEAAFVLSATFVDSDVPPDLPGNSPSDYLCIACIFGDPLTVIFDSPVDAFGFNLAIGRSGDLVGGGAINISVFDAGGSLLDSRALTVNGLSAFDSFAGFANLGSRISRVRVDLATADPSTDFTAIDNLSFGTTVVPVPAALYLFGTGLLALAGVARRR